MPKTAESTTIRISKSTLDELKKLARDQEQSMQTVLNAAIEKYQQYVMMRQLNEDYSGLKKNKKSWDEEMKDRKLWENTLSDGLQND